MSFLYTITCRTTGKSYVGSTNNLQRRFCEHRRMLRTGRHDNVHLQRAWDLEGELSFTFSLLREVTGDRLDAEAAELADRGAAACYNLSPVVRRGGLSPNAKLSPDQVLLVRAAIAERVPHAVLATRFGVCYSTISRVARGHTHGHAPMPDCRSAVPHPQRLSEDDVVAIRRSDDMIRVLADRYGVTQRTIWLARTGRSHPHVSEPIPAKRATGPKRRAA